MSICGASSRRYAALSAEVSWMLFRAVSALRSAILSASVEEIFQAHSPGKKSSSLTVLATSGLA